MNRITLLEELWKALQSKQRSAVVIPPWFNTVIFVEGNRIYHITFSTSKRLEPGVYSDPVSMGKIVSIIYSKSRKLDPENVWRIVEPHIYVDKPFQVKEAELIQLVRSLARAMWGW